jgi:hypothetical protein
VSVARNSAYVYILSCLSDSTRYVILYYYIEVTGGGLMETRTEIIKAELANGTILHIQATALGGEEEVSFTVPSFQEVTAAIEGIAESITATLLDALMPLPPSSAQKNSHPVKLSAMVLSAHVLLVPLQNVSLTLPLLCRALLDYYHSGQPPVAPVVRTFLVSLGACRAGSG